MAENLEGRVLRARREVADINMQTLIEAGEVVKCVGVSAPVVGNLYTVEVAHFGKAETTKIRIDKDAFANFEVIK